MFEIAYGIQIAPVVQAASARPYNLTAGLDLNADGNNNDRYIDPATGHEVNINSARGDNTFDFDMRATKFFGIGGDKKIGIFGEFFNIFNTVNFGSLSSNGMSNARSTTFRQPTAFIPGLGIPRQAQFGARFTF